MQGARRERSMMINRPESQSHAKRGSDEISINVDPLFNSPLITSLKKKMDDSPTEFPNYCIYRVPTKFRQPNEKFFTPQLVSVGPFHHGLRALRYMEKHKPAYLQAFLNRSHLSLGVVVMMIKDWESRIRDCYTEPIDLSSDDFVQMVLLDSCFVIEVIYRREVLQRGQRTDYLSRSTMISDVRTDLILLENQLPFFVLEGLYNKAFPNGKNFRVLCLTYFEKVMLTRYSEKLLRTKSHSSVTEIKHILDLLRAYHVPSAPRPARGDDKRRVNRMRKATELQDSGMVVKEKEDEYSSVSDISYTKGELEMPKIIMNIAVEHLLRNLLAFERCHYQQSTDITDYLHFLDDLIDTVEDVDMLIGNGILENFLSDSKAVATLISDLRTPFHSRRYYYTEIRDQINEYCKEPWHSWRATLHRDYCSSPWIVASTMAAAALLILTLIQTVCSVVSARKQE